MASEIEKVFIWNFLEGLDSSTTCRRPQALTPQRKRAMAEHSELVSANQARSLARENGVLP
jgi:hypothetical protein